MRRKRSGRRSGAWITALRRNNIKIYYSSDEDREDYCYDEDTAHVHINKLIITRFSYFNKCVFMHNGFFAIIMANAFPTSIVFSILLLSLTFTFQHSIFICNTRRGTLTI